jgi:pimeloyl-ACP methyl ester carboxylesterase
VERLVLIDAAGFNLLAGDRPALVRLTAHPLAEWVLRALPIRRLVVKWGLRQVLHDRTKLTAERLEEYLAAASRPGTLASIRSLGSSAQLDPRAFEGVLRGIVAPTLVIWGSEDTWIPPAHSDRFVAAIAGARKVMLPGVGHVPEEEDPAAVNRLLQEFLSAGPS